MQTITITGYSDDNIEIDGAIREEIPFFPTNPHDAVALCVSDSTVLSVRYDEHGIWRVTPIYHGTAKIEKTEGSASADTFDVVTLTADKFQWICVGKQIIRA
jgi:hypothetical protein